MFGWHKARCFKVIIMNIVKEWRYKLGCGALVNCIIMCF